MRSIVTYELVLEHLGGEPTRASPRLRKDIDHAIETIRHDAEIRVELVRLDVLGVEDGWARLEQDLVVRSRRISPVFFHCDEAVVFVITLGSAIDQDVAEAMADRPHSGTVVDAAASVAAETAVAELTASLRRQLPADRSVTPAYSPGYCDWPLREQRELFRVLPPEPAGVHLSDRCLMTPRKSVSGVIGVGDRDRVDRFGLACLQCDRTDCTHRRTG